MRDSAAASDASRVTRAQSCAASASAGVSQEPPTQATLGSARNSRAFCAVTPPVALACIEAIAREVPEAVIGAGTVRSAADAQAAALAGARFAVSPGYTHAVGRACHELGLALLPGVATGSEIMMAQEDGYTALKFFPALQAGGAAMLKAWHGPFNDVKFCPTGGVTVQNAREFLALPNVACVGGSWLTPADALAAQDWARVTRLAAEAAALSRK